VLVFWRLDQAKFGATWDSGEGSYLAGGRWNSRGTRAVYAALDPATAILEVAVHTTFRTLDIVPHVLTSARIADSAGVHIVRPLNAQPELAATRHHQRPAAGVWRRHVEGASVHADPERGVGPELDRGLRSGGGNGLL
jgi:RES domain-containing protein